MNKKLRSKRADFKKRVRGAISKYYAEGDKFDEESEAGIFNC